MPGEASSPRPVVRSSSSPEKILDFHGHVIGLALSRDETQLFVNVRPWPENAVPTMTQPPPVASQIEMHVVDMRTLEKTGQVQYNAKKMLWSGSTPISPN